SDLKIRARSVFQWKRRCQISAFAGNRRRLLHSQVYAVLMWLSVNAVGWLRGGQKQRGRPGV
ncbi:hypothetical protein ACFPSG_004964, partial [Salmonella enterica]